MELEIRGGFVDEWSLLCPIWKANKKDAEEGSDQSKTRDVRDKAHALFRCS